MCCPHSVRLIRDIIILLFLCHVDIWQVSSSAPSGRSSDFTASFGVNIYARSLWRYTSCFLLQLSTPSSCHPIYRCFYWLLSGMPLFYGVLVALLTARFSLDPSFGSLFRVFSLLFYGIVFPLWLFSRQFSILKSVPLFFGSLLFCFIWLLLWQPLCLIISLITGLLSGCSSDNLSWLFFLESGFLSGYSSNSSTRLSTFGFSDLYAYLTHSLYPTAAPSSALLFQIRINALYHQILCSLRLSFSYDHSNQFW